MDPLRSPAMDLPPHPAMYPHLMPQIVSQPMAAPVGTSAIEYSFDGDESSGDWDLRDAGWPTVVVASAASALVRSAQPIKPR